MDADQFAFFRLEQKGVDARITTYDPDGQKIQFFDSPNGKKGDEIITLFSGKKGNYILRLLPWNLRARRVIMNSNGKNLNPKVPHLKNRSISFLQPGITPKVQGRQ